MLLQDLLPVLGALDPDGGSCDFSWVFHFDRGQIGGVEVAGLNMGFLGNLPGNVLDGNVRLLVVVDDAATDGEQEALLAAFTGSRAGRWRTWPGWSAKWWPSNGRRSSSMSTRALARSGSAVISRARYKVSGRATGTRRAGRRRVSPVLGTPAYPGSAVRFQVTAAQQGFEFSAGSSTQSEFRYVAA